MRTKYLLTAAVLGGVVSFAWGSVSHMAAVLPGSKFTNLAPPLTRQMLVEIGVAFILAWVLLRLPGMTAFQTGILFGIVGVAAGAEELLPLNIWYGFPRPEIAAEGVDLIVGWFLLGLVLGALRNRMAPAPAT